MSTNRLILFLPGLLMVLVLDGCSGGGSGVGEAVPAPKIYVVRGEVIRLIPQDRVVVLKHEDIEGWMKAMTMEFPIAEQADFDKLSPGDYIEAKLYVQDLDYHLVEIRVVPKAGADDSQPASSPPGQQ